MVYTLDLLQIGFICFITFLVTMAIIILVEPMLDITKEKETIARVLNVFWISSLVFLLYVLFLPTRAVPDFLKIEKEYIVLLSAIGIVLSAFMASISVMKNIENANNIEKQKKYKEDSEFYLNKSISELNNVYDLLKDKNNDRVTWILAARVLNMALELSQKISVESHKEFYNLHEFQLKHKLLELFSSKEYQMLSFYIGHHDPINLNDDLAITEYFKNENKIKHLNDISIYEIFSFLEYPDDFKDPLNDTKATKIYDNLDTWTRKGSIIEFKKYARKYFELIEDRDSRYSQRVYKNNSL